MIPSKPLLRRTLLRPHESLPSLVYRLAEANYYQPITLLKTAVLQGLTDRQLWKPIDSQTFIRLSQLSQLTIAELHQATAHALDTVLTPPESSGECIDINGRLYPILAHRIAVYQLRPENDTQYCPLCLIESNYHRLTWMPIAVSACLKHQCLLVHRCPQCRRAIRVQDLIKGSCRHCDYSLIDAPVIDLSDDPVGLWTQWVIQSWFGFTERPLANKEIPIEPPSVLYRVADGLRHCLMRLPANTDGVYRLPTLPNPLPCRRKTDLVPSVSYQLYAMAVRAMTNWPYQFHNFVQTYRESQPNRSFHRGLQADFGILYSQWIAKQWREDPYQLIQKAFDQYLIDAEYHHLPATKRSGKANTTRASDLITFREAMEILRVNEATMNRLIERGVLSHYDTPDRFSFVDAQEVIELRHRWDNAVSLSDCAGLLGTSKEVIKELIEANYLTSVRGPETDGGFLWLVSQESIEQLCQAFAQEFIEGVGELSLAQAVQTLQPLNISMSQLLIVILEGRLPLYQPSNNQWNLQTVTLKNADLQAYAEQVRTKRGWLTKVEVAWQLGVKPATLSAWHNLLQPIENSGHTHHYRQVDVEAFQSNYLSTEEASVILGIGRLTVQKWARNGRLTSATTGHRYLFHRADIERLRPENRLTASQTAKLLGISRTQLTEWVQQGKIIPVSGPNIDQMRHYLFLRSDIESTSGLKRA